MRRNTRRIDVITPHKRHELERVGYRVIREDPCSESHAAVCSKNVFRAPPSTHRHVLTWYTSTNTRPNIYPLPLRTETATLVLGRPLTSPGGSNAWGFDLHPPAGRIPGATASTLFFQTGTDPPLMASRQRERVGAGQTTNFAIPARAVGPFSTRSHTSLPRARAQTAATPQPDRFQGSRVSRRSMTASSRRGSSRPRGGHGKL